VTVISVRKLLPPSAFGGRGKEERNTLSCSAIAGACGEKGKERKKLSRICSRKAGRRRKREKKED
jgi:hypothetical protein